MAAATFGIITGNFKALVELLAGENTRQGRVEYLISKRKAGSLFVS